MNFKYPVIILALLLLTACGATSQKTTIQSREKVEIVVPTFNADSAYVYVKEQCELGPRVPGSKAHAACKEYLISQFEKFGADTIIVQKGEERIYDGRKMPLFNIIASYGIDKPNRILISSHWDSRPYADNDINPDRRKEAIIGANDGASGVGVIMEIARHLSAKDSPIGVDLILFDLEDYGAPDWEKSKVEDGGWALGSKYWSRHKHIKGYQAQYGILLDMVGAANAQFYREYFSDQYAGWVVDRVWTRAADMGMTNMFVNQRGGGVTDDHLNVIKGGVPCIDIIQFQHDTESGFGDFWHTHNDNIEVIDRNTLGMVGQLMLQLIYNP